ncbi:TIGR04282 family arsenosugar biosynthesis glycosyltransferase [Litchfieldella rifensis]|uniref:TIGR04282 family arsenosugar biosynthesis glycosyltransferase n=1 Tax=Litchfieldella rifensis TaxID=762643 RepID=A0ABV7LRF3_9GAMM
MRAETPHGPSPRASFPLAILAKAPVPGQVKTRLIPRLGKQGAAQLHERLLRHTLTIALEATSAEHIVLWTALEHSHTVFLELAKRHGIALRAQPAGDLGKRMHYALLSMRGPGLVIGSDCPVLSPALLSRCWHALQDADGVFLPAEDGGYALVGTRRSNMRLFEHIDWGTERVMAQTRRRADELGWNIAYPAEVWDIDRPEDIERWQRLAHCASES